MYSRWDGFFPRVVISLVVTSVFVVTGVALVNRGINDRVHKIKRVADLTVAPAPPGGANYLIIGSDTRAFATDQNDVEAYGSPDDANTSGQRSDTLMVAHVEPGPQQTFVVSFPRDLMVDVPGLPGKNRINSAYARPVDADPPGGAQGVIDTLKTNFGIEINHYLEVDFKTFQKIVDTIGSVRVFLPGNIRDQETGLASGPVTGCYALNGGQALAYVRARSIEIQDPNGTIVDEDGTRWRKLDIRADLDRIGRQQQFIRKIAGLAISQSLNDPILGVELIDNVLSYISVDKGLSRDDVNALVRAFKTVDVNDQSSVRFETLPVDPDPDNPNVTLVPSADAEAVIEQLRSFGDNTPKPAAVQPAQVQVRVVDATGTSIGQSVVSKLVEQGFQATSGPARPTKVAVTEIHYTLEQAAQAKALTTYFPDAKLVPDANAGATVQLVLGSSFPGTITVPSTTTTVAPSTVPGAPATTAPATTTTTGAPIPSDPCA
ncbi:MAG TPA: LCP family protein [Acidimicrobiia bacterium]|jgi:LCP family protein required for cell wall assembly